MRTSFMVLSLFAAVASGSYAPVTQTPGLTIIAPDSAVPGLPLDRPAVEPHMAADPVDARHLLGAAIIGDAAAAFGPSQTCASIVTFDGGRTWTTHMFDLQNCGDPWVAVGWDGDAWFSALGRREGAVGNRLFLFRSEDGGRTWPHPPVDFGPGQDHQTLVVAPPFSATRGMVYVLSGLGGRGGGLANFRIFIGRSEDRGRSWLDPLILSPSNLNVSSLAGDVLDDGSLLVPFIDSQPGAMPSPRRSWTYRANAGLSDVSPPLFVSGECGAGQGFPSLVTIPKSTRALFLCGAASGQGILIHITENGGASWSPASRVDPVDPPVVQRTASAAASADAVAVTWMDGRDSGADCFRLRGTVSFDGGRTFLPPQMLSTMASCPQTERNGAAAKRWRYNGDYAGLAASSDGRFHALWADSRTGIYQLRFISFEGKQF